MNPQNSRVAAAGAMIALFACQSGQAAQTYHQLRYKLGPGERLVSSVSHQSETQTKIAGVTEDSSSRSDSIKVWEVESVDQSGNMTFVYQIDKAEMSQTIDDENVTYDSTAGTEIPVVFQKVADSVSKPLATITIDPTGNLVRRDRDFKNPFLGLGEVAIALPQEPVAVGAEWQVQRDLRLPLDERRTKMIKVRELYRLEKVSAGVATISIRTQPLTPIVDPSIQAQLIQQLSKGTIKFDIDTGRLLSKQLDWSEQVLGFQGADSSMRYNATWTEELLPSTARIANKVTHE